MTDVTLHYQDDCILHERLYVTFVDEPADDFLGVTKDMFSSVWKAIRERFLTGENYSRFYVAPGNLCSVKEYVVFGRILEHGFDLVGFVPIFLNQAQLFFIMTGVVPSIDLILKGFYDCLAASEVDLIKEAIMMDNFDEEFKSKLMDLFSSYEIKGLPKPEYFLSFLQEIAMVEVITKPYFALCHVARKIWPADEDLFLERLRLMKPDGKKITTLLKEPDSSDPHIERVFSFLTRFTNGLDEGDARTFLKFVTGIEVLDENRLITVQFNGVTDPERMVPTAHSCGNVLTLSKYFLAYNHFENIFKKVIDHTEFWNSFSLI